MWLDAYLQTVIIRAQIAEAHQQAALRQRVREARPPRSSRRRRVGELIARAASMLSLKRCIERTALR